MSRQQRQLARPASVSTLERDAERHAAALARLEQRSWRGPAALAMHLIIGALSLTRVTHLVAHFAHRANLHLPALSEVDVPVHGLPRSLEGLRLGHISDFHVGPLWPLVNLHAAIELLAQARPDVIAITGDLIDHRPRDVVPTVRVLAALTAPLGVFAVFGNHDHRVGPRRVLAAAGEHAPQLRFLVNQAARLPFVGAPLWIAGLDSLYVGRSNAQAALRSVPHDATCVLLAHEPDVADSLPRPVMLVLSGHAHGGQIRLGRRPLMLPPHGRRYPDGLARSSRGWVHTSRGLGWTGIPLRVDCAPEVTILRLTAASGERR